MTATDARSTTHRGPERPGGQGLDPNQEESGNRAIEFLLTTPEGEAWTDFVATHRSGPNGGAYEAWSRRGMVRWTRHHAEAGGYEYRVVEVVGQDPLAAQDYRALNTLQDQLEAAGSDDPASAFIEPEVTTYPYAYERIAQLFDSPNAPDLVVNPRSFAYGRQPGQHGGLDVVQARAPLVFSGPGVKAGAVVDAEARAVDIAPTIARLLDMPLIDGRDGSGRSSSQRGVPPDVYFKRQDGRVLEAVLDDDTGKPERVYILLLDGQSHMELTHRLETESDSLPHLRSLIGRGTMLQYGSISNFPSITWPSHNAIGTACWSGHHDIVNPTYYLRESKQTVSPQGQQFDSARFLGDEVETLFEAVHRAFGPWDGAMGGAFTASINEPCVRGADHGALERQLVGDREWLKELTRETEVDISPRWADELQRHGHHLIGLTDNRALAQARQLFLDSTHPAPKLVYHEFSLPDGASHDYGPHHPGAREALDETDIRIGRILNLLDDKDLFESTLFVITADHGMAVQNVELNANPARLPERHGMATVTTEPLIYLRDLDIAVGVAHDGRTAQVSVLDNDRDEAGQQHRISGAQIRVIDNKGRQVATSRTDTGGNAGLAIPADLRPDEMTMEVSAEGFNVRHIRLDGTNVAPDLRTVLYGA